MAENKNKRTDEQHRQMGPRNGTAGQAELAGQPLALGGASLRLGEQRHLGPEHAGLGQAAGPLEAPRGQAARGTTASIGRGVWLAGIRNLGGKRYHAGCQWGAWVWGVSAVRCRSCDDAGRILAECRNFWASVGHFLVILVTSGPFLPFLVNSCYFWPLVSILHHVSGSFGI